MPSDELATMYGNPMWEFLMFLVDFVVFSTRSIYFLLETLILTILPNRYRKLKVSYFKPQNFHQHVYCEKKCDFYNVCQSN